MKEKNGSVQLVTSVQNDDFRLVNVGSAATVNLKNGVQVNLKAHWWILEIWVPKQFKNSIEGLCGNYNGDRSDDFISRDGQKYSSATTDFKESWILDDKDCDPKDDPDPERNCDEQKIARECAKLLGGAYRFSSMTILYGSVKSVKQNICSRSSSPDKTKMVILLSVMNLLTHNHIMRIVFLISVRVVPIRPAAYSICTFQRAHLIQPKLIVTGQKN